MGKIPRKDKGRGSCIYGNTKQGRLRQAAMAAGKVGRGEGDVISSKTSRLKLKLKKRKGAI